jgi:cellulose synthase/poly-beta-1,6-N-acetylglucosamine synthase-like glycosyltransferase
MALLDQGVDRRTFAHRPKAGAEPVSIGPLPSFLADKPPAPSGNDNQRSLFDQGPADELDCLRDVLATERLAAAEARSRRLGIGAEQVLIQSGEISEQAYLERLSRHTGIAIESLTGLDRTDTPLSDRQIPCAAASGILPLYRNGRLVRVLAPRLRTVRTLCRLVAAHPHVRADIRLATAASLQQFLTQQGGSALGRMAALGLHDSHPALSAAPTASTAPWRGRLRRGSSVAAAVLLPPVLMPDIFSGLLALWFLGFAAMRLAGALWPRPALRQRPPEPDGRLPVYSVVVALYREAASVAPLMQAVEALDYPREKLDVLLVVEPDDHATRAAIDRLGAMPHVQLLVAPARAPRTKPKALNWALPFVRGSFVAVFDAEDRPEPGQLRAAVATFQDAGAEVACAQASLSIDNETHSSLSRMFAAEYAGQFDVVLPGMSAMRLPLPLGGSSNHFRTNVLREVGGWDAYNVTEDADLGFRLARRGYRSVTFASTTYEEAPIRFGNWLRQRSRWMKGWLQTWCVHMRSPRQLWRDLGFGGFLVVNLVAGGNLMTALAYPVLIYLFLIDVLASRPAPWPWLHLSAITIACVSTVTVGWMGLSHRGRRRDGWILLLTPLYWGCLSIAAWRAVLHYVWNPYHWEKTEHGVAKRRRPAAALRRPPARRPHR